MTVGDANKMPGSGGTMSDHLKKYRDYIDELKQGRSSGISAAFGRATDLLPPEVMAIKAEPVDLVAQLIDLESSVLSDDYDRDYLKESVRSLVEAYVDDWDDAVGRVVETENGREEVLSIYVENGQRMFMLSDLSTIDELTFHRTLVASAAAASASEIAEESAELASSEPEQEVPFGLAVDHESTTQPQSITVNQSISPVVSQVVTTSDGLPLWQVYYSAEGPELVSMADGGIIKRAEGRKEYVFSRLSPTDGDIKFFILSGFVVDPSTGNVYFEANEGAYTAAFLNNGWTIHQYLSSQGDESFFVTEPVRPDRLPITMKVKSLDLDLSTGEVTYETMDSAASITLKSRKLSG
ncbi:hypothetical protein KBI23_14340 [bacterium]|nr:hypothetical protein [bacterium]MBP9811067.1 hypothetical protein [bacterium]